MCISGKSTAHVTVIRPVMAIKIFFVLIQFSNLLSGTIRNEIGFWEGNYNSLIC